MQGYGSNSANGSTDADSAAALLALSEERDQWTKRLLDAERAAYMTGYADGRADQARDDDRAWAAQPPLRLAVVPSHAEIEAARWAREHFGAPRPGDLAVSA